LPVHGTDSPSCGYRNGHRGPFLSLYIRIPRGRISQASHPLKIQIFTTTHATSASFTILFKSIPFSRSLVLSLLFYLLSPFFLLPYKIIRDHLPFNPDLYIPLYKERKENKYECADITFLNS